MSTFLAAVLWSGSCRPRRASLVLCSHSALKSIGCHHSEVLSALGSARQICSLLSHLPLQARLLHCGGAFCGWLPWKHTLGDGSCIETRALPHTWPASIGDLRLELLCSLSSVYTLLSAFCHPDVWWNHLAFDVPPISFTTKRLSPFLFH